MELVRRSSQSHCVFTPRLYVYGAFTACHLTYCAPAPFARRCHGVDFARVELLYRVPVAFDSMHGHVCVMKLIELLSCFYHFVSGKKSAFTVTGEPALGSETNSLKFTSVITNIGQHYSTETGQFTCEYPGIYVFSLNILKAGGATRANCEIRQNQVNVARAHSNPDVASNGGWYSSSASAVIRLEYGDIVNVVCSSGLSSLYELSFYNSFAGFLIKAD